MKLSRLESRWPLPGLVLEWVYEITAYATETANEGEAAAALLTSACSTRVLSFRSSR